MDDLLVYFCSMTLGAVLCLAAASKLATPLARRKALLAPFRLIPSFLRAPVALLLPWTELALGVLALAALFWEPVHWAILVLLAFFTLTVALEIGSGKKVNCGCFGDSARADTDPRLFLGRNLLLSVAAIIALAGPPEALDPIEVLDAILLSAAALLAYAILKSLLVDPVHPKKEGSGS